MNKSHQPTASNNRTQQWSRLAQLTNLGYLLLISLISAPPARAKVKIDQQFRIGDKSIRNTFPYISTMLNPIIQNVFVLAGIILLIYILMAGFGIITSAGRQDPQGIEKSKSRLNHALIGFGLIFGSYWLIQLIETLTNIKILNPDF